MNAAMSDKENGNNPWFTVARYMGLGLEVSITIIFSLYVGDKLDEWYGHTPLFIIISLIIGFAVVIKILINYSKRATEDMDREKDQ